MPSLSDALIAEGALVSILVGVSASTVQILRSALRPIPPPVVIRALLDTGAEMTGIDATLVQSLDPTSAGWQFANLPAHGGLLPVMLRDISLTILHPSGNPADNLVLRDWTVLELPLAPLHYEAVIGRDVLARCDFLFSGRSNSFQLTY